MRLLVVEDHPAVARSLAKGLRRHGAAVDVALDGDAALLLARAHPYDVVVLDRDIPGTHGDDVCRELHAGGPGPKVLMVTAARSTQDLVDGLALGADDYLPKPFRFAELVARVHALARRAGTARPGVLHFEDIVLDPARQHVTRAGRPIALTRKEFGVLHALLSAPGVVISAEALTRAVWDENADLLSSTMRMTVMRLRRKLGSPDVVRTVPGVGYQAQGVER